MHQPFMSDLQIIDNTSLHRFELQQDNEIAFIVYTKTQDSLRLVHTEVPPSLQGKGVGSQLVGGVLKLARQQGLSVVPSCPFVFNYVRRHREYLPILDPNHRRMIENET